MDLHATFKEGGRTSSQGKARNRTHSVLATAEIALALALLTGAGIFVQNFLHEVYAGFGIDPNQVLTANLSLSSTRYKEPSKEATSSRASSKTSMRFRASLRGCHIYSGTQSQCRTASCDVQHRRPACVVTHEEGTDRLLHN